MNGHAASCMHDTHAGQKSMSSETQLMQMPDAKPDARASDEEAQTASWKSHSAIRQTSNERQLNMRAKSLAHTKTMKYFSA
jgi:hypothetical protein